MPNAFDNAAARLKELLPKRPNGQAITAWEEQRKALNSMLARIGDAEKRLTALEGGQSEPPPDPPPPPPPPTPDDSYAPRTHNWTPSADARFCMKDEYGTRRVTSGDNPPPGAVFIDRRNVFYDAAGRDLGGRSNGEGSVIPELKGGNSMDGLEPCDEYVGPTGVRIGGAAGYPARSFEQ
jgi:hypothetical protein